MDKNQCHQKNSENTKMFHLKYENRDETYKKKKKKKFSFSHVVERSYLKFLIRFTTSRPVTIPRLIYALSMSAVLSVFIGRLYPLTIPQFIR